MLGGILPRLSKKNASVLKRDRTMDFKPNITGTDKTYPMQITQVSRDLTWSRRSLTKIREQSGCRMLARINRDAVSFDGIRLGEVKDGSQWVLIKEKNKIKSSLLPAAKSCGVPFGMWQIVPGLNGNRLPPMRKRPLPLTTWQTTSSSVWLICFGLDFFVGLKAIRPLVNCFSPKQSA